MKKLELIDFSLVAIAMGYLYFAFSILGHNIPLLNWISGSLSIVVAIFFFVGILPGFYVLFNKRKEKDKKYWLLLGFEIVNILLIATLVSNIGNM